MSEVNPATDTWEAIKARLAGPAGTFILVWALEHAKIMSYVFFDSVGKSDLSQADAKIQSIKALLLQASTWTLLWRPILWTIFILIVSQIVSLLWHFVSDKFRYLKEVISHQNNLKTHIYRSYSKNPDTFIQDLQGKIKEASKIMAEVQSPYSARAMVDGQTQANIQTMLERTKQVHTLISDIHTIVTVGENPEKKAIKKINSIKQFSEKVKSRFKR